MIAQLLQALGSESNKFLDSPLVRLTIQAVEELVDLAPERLQELVNHSPGAS